MRRETSEEAAEAALRERGARALAWLFDQALPLWATRGRSPAAGFYDKLGPDLQPSDAPLRLRVQARQVYVFAEAGRLGWSGDWRSPMEHGLDFLLNRATRLDGLTARTFDQRGEVIDAEPDLYEQAFAVFAYAAAFAAQRDGRALKAARALARALEPQAHPLGGYREFSGRWLRANPNMHMFEAVSWWAELDPEGPWTALADGYARLCAERLTDRVGDALREVFDADWRPAPAPLGDCTEPGHHFEWAWLLNQRPGPAPADLALRLCERAERVGVDSARQVAVNAVGADGALLDGGARLWPQTERLKAALVMRPHDPELWSARACQAHDGLFSYMDAAAAPGLWLDRMALDGGFRQEASPASSLYHITCAVSELARATGVVQARW